MLKSISFKNYKSFQRKTKLEIKPLTILVGPNNAGKTSITDLFALFKQSTSGNYEPNSFFVFDGKDRSLISILLNSCKNKFAIYSKDKIKLLYKIFNISFIKNDGQK